MKKRIKYIDLALPQSQNNLYAKYQKQFEYFLGKQKGDPVYVPDIDVENALQEVKSDLQNNIVYLIGKTGIGKTTLIKKIFSEENNTVKYDCGQHMITLSINFHGKLLENNILNFLVNSIHGLNSYLEKQFDIQGKFLSLPVQMEFYDYIEHTSLDLLGHASTIELMEKKSDQEIKLFQLQKGQELDRYTYEASRLKFYLQNYCKEIDKIIVVIDNIEALPEELHKRIVLDTLSMFSCLENQLKAKDLNYFFVNIVFSLKVSTYNQLLKDPVIRTYRPTTKIYKSNAIDMLAYIQQKNKILMESQPDNLEDWQNAYSILETLCTRFNGKYSNMLQNLCNYNFEEIKDCYIRILSNSIWFDEYDFDQINIAKIENIFNNISVIRSLACNSKIYRSSQSKIIPNVFVNDELNDDSIIAMLLLNYFYRNYSAQDLYGVDNCIQQKNIIRIFDKIFNRQEKIINSVEWVMANFFENNILSHGVQLKEDNLVEYIFLTPKGKEIWRMLSYDSVLLEMYREEHFLEESYTDIAWMPSYELMKKDQVYIFIQLLIYIGILLQQEEEYKKLSIKNNTVEYYHSCFGKRLMAKHLLNGVMRSIEYSGNQNNNDIINELGKLEKQMKQVHTLS